jgi:hypothetical protein
MVIVQNNPRISVSRMLSAYESQNTKRVYRGVLRGFFSFIYPELTDENLDSFSLNYLDSPRARAFEQVLVLFWSIKTSTLMLVVLARAS